MRSLKLVISVCVFILISSCNRFDGSIYKGLDGFYIKNTSGNKIIKYTIKIKRTIENTYTEGITYKTLNPGDYSRISPISILIGEPYEKIYKEKFGIKTVSYPHFESMGSNPFVINRAAKLHKNTTEPEDYMKYVLQDNLHFVKILDSVVLKDTTRYRILLRYTAYDRTVRLKQKLCAYSFNIVGSIPQ